MTAPKIVRTGVFRADGRDVDVVGLDALCIALVATSDETEDARALAEVRHVRITIEPADAPEVEPAPEPGTPLDYLERLKEALRDTLDGHAITQRTESAIRRCASLANAASLAILAEKRGQP